MDQAAFNPLQPAAATALEAQASVLATHASALEAPLVVLESSTLDLLLPAASSPLSNLSQPPPCPLDQPLSLPILALLESHSTLDRPLSHLETLFKLQMDMAAQLVPSSLAEETASKMLDPASSTLVPMSFPATLDPFPAQTQIAFNHHRDQSLAIPVQSQPILESHLHPMPSRPPTAMEVPVAQSSLPPLQSSAAKAPPSAQV